MTTAVDFIPIEIKKVAAIAIASLALVVAGAHIQRAFKTGVVQRLSDTPRYTRTNNPVMFWLLVIFFAVSSVLFLGLVIRVLSHWHDERVF